MNRTIEDELRQTVYELAGTKPAEPPDERLTRAEHAVYWRGYYYALQTALRAMDLAVVRFAMRPAPRARRDRSLRKSA